ncbi:MAG: N-(5'-phosphoribosyl)anthranilate isomerase, partial [Steroidobacteraceae bacterium]
WVKVCGMTSESAVSAAVIAGVDAIGFVFAPSQRRVTPLQALRFASGIPARIQRLAVMLHPAQGEVDEVLRVFKPDVLQCDWQDLSALQLPKELTLLPVLRAGGELPMELPRRFLFEGAASGTGETADWTQAAELAKKSELILAGGLNSANVDQAIKAVRPFGVDVSSGVESMPGVKDSAKIFVFVHTARAAL